MGDDRSPEERAAQNTLQTAVEGLVNLYRNDDTGLVTDWVLVVATETFEGGAASYYTMMAGGSMSDHRAIGLLEAGKWYMTQNLGAGKAE